jgi:hypothetical protein
VKRLRGPASASELIALIMTQEWVTEVKAVGISAAGNIRGGVMRAAYKSRSFNPRNKREQGWKGSAPPR